MKMTRKQLRKLILNEIRIKPSIPGASEEQYTKILDLARNEDPALRRQADDLASALGYDPIPDDYIYDPIGDDFNYDQLPDFPGQKSTFSDELYQYDNLPVDSPEVEYIQHRLENSTLASFVNVYESELSEEFNKSYTREQLNNILNDLGWPWELKYEYAGLNSGEVEYYFEYDQQM